MGKIKMATEKEKRCENCEFYLQHYAKIKKLVYPIFCGHCVCDSYKHAKTRGPNYVCEFWKKRKISIEKRRKREVAEALVEISYRLDDLKEYLTDRETINKNAKVD